MKYLILLVAVFFSSCSKIEEPQFRAFENFKVINIGLDEVNIGFGIRYYNPNNFTVTVKETETDIFLDDVILGRFSQEGNENVGDNAEFTIYLTGKIPVATFLQLNLKDIHRREVALRVVGTTKVGKGGIFINRKIGYAGRHRLDQIRF